ncbi:hypothetical protein RI129_008662 [Pyrocoelia pectoralis]|uniref:Uncharacterized protein n=1 Tax=Pyrocoelia pectoralis TaxID=417401 RepID=A0AAN7V5V9_9COLE
MVKNIIKLVLVVALCSQSLAQFFGGGGFLPSGGIGGMGGYKYGPAWGSLSGSFDGRRLGPVNVGSGAHFKLPNDGFAGGRVAVQPGVGGMGSLYGKVNILDGPSHNLNIQGHHDRFLTKDLKPFGPPTNGLDVNYKHVNGATAHIGASQINGGPIQGSVGASVPLVKTPNGGINLGVRGTAAQGMKPQGEIGVVGSFDF